MKKINYRIFGGSIVIDEIETFINKINNFTIEKEIHIQVFDAGMICGKNHLESAIFHTIRAFDQKRMAVQTLEMELMLYASGERQLTKAIPKIGVKKGKTMIAVALFSKHHSEKILDSIIDEIEKRFHIKKNDSILNISTEKMKRWEISDSILKNLSIDEYEDMILEKVAYVDIIK